MLSPSSLALKSDWRALLGAMSRSAADVRCLVADIAEMNTRCLVECLLFRERGSGMFRRRESLGHRKTELLNYDDVGRIDRKGKAKSGAGCSVSTTRLHVGSVHVHVQYMYVREGLVTERLHSNRYNYNQRHTDVVSHSRIVRA